MPEEAQKAKMALQALALRAILLTVVDDGPGISYEGLLDMLSFGSSQGGGRIGQWSPAQIVKSSAP